MQPAEQLELGILIADKITALKQEVASYREAARPVAPDNAIGRLSRMEAINSKAMGEAALRQAEQTLARLQQALEQLDSPDFGLCMDCEEEIPFARLKARPESVRCVACASRR